MGEDLQMSTPSLPAGLWGPEAGNPLVTSYNI